MVVMVAKEMSWKLVKLVSSREHAYVVQPVSPNKRFRRDFPEHTTPAVGTASAAATVLLPVHYGD